MAYADAADLLHQMSYMERCYACVRVQALVFVNDARPEYKTLANAVIAAPTSDSAYTVVVMTTAQPGMSVDSTDGDLDAAVQYVWPLVGAALIGQSTP